MTKSDLRIIPTSNSQMDYTQIDIKLDALPTAQYLEQFRALVSVNPELKDSIFLQEICDLGLPIDEGCLLHLATEAPEIFLQVEELRRKTNVRICRSFETFIDAMRKRQSHLFDTYASQHFKGPRTPGPHWAFQFLLNRGDITAISLDPTLESWLRAYGHPAERLDLQTFLVYYEQIRHLNQLRHSILGPNGTAVIKIRNGVAETSIGPQGMPGCVGLGCRTCYSCRKAGKRSQGNSGSGDIQAPLGLSAEEARELIQFRAVLKAAEIETPTQESTSLVDSTAILPSTQPTPEPVEPLIFPADAAVPARTLDLSCAICLDRERNCIVMPCNHLCCCHGCGVNLTQCPICRTSITSLHPVFIA